VTGEGGFHVGTVFSQEGTSNPVTPLRVFSSAAAQVPGCCFLGISRQPFPCLGLLCVRLSACFWMNRFFESPVLNNKKKSMRLSNLDRQKTPLIRIGKFVILRRFVVNPDFYGECHENPNPSSNPLPARGLRACFSVCRVGSGTNPAAFVQQPQTGGADASARGLAGLATIGK